MVIVAVAGVEAVEEIYRWVNKRQRTYRERKLRKYLRSRSVRARRQKSGSGSSWYSVGSLCGGQRERKGSGGDGERGRHGRYGDVGSRSVDGCAKQLLSREADQRTSRR
jgi:hypothetical protein